MLIQTDIPPRPAVLRATREIGLSDIALARALDLTTGALGQWVSTKRPIPPTYHVALFHVVVATLRDRIAATQPVDPRHVKIREAALEAAQRWLDLAAEELKSFSADDVARGTKLGKDLLKKLEAAGVIRRG